MKKVITYIILTAFLFGTMEIALKIAGSTFDSIQLTFLRFLIGGLVLAPFGVAEIRKDNIKITKEVIKVAHPLGVSVEAELGTIGDIKEDSGNREIGSKEIIFTKPEDAKKFVEETGCDTLAIAIGTAHGIYPKDFVPHLEQELLTEIKNTVSIPLVLHGGSANPDSEIAEAVKRGVNKINISSDIKDAFYQQLRKTLGNDSVIREPFDLYLESIDAMKEVVNQKIDLFNDADKMKYYKL